MSLPRFSVQNGVLVNLATLTILVGGVYCGLTLVRELFPESRPERVMITTLYPGATPADVEKGITLKIEEKVKDVEGVNKIRSTVTEGRSVILVEMESGFRNLDQAVTDVKDAIDSIPPEDFPEEALQSRVAKFEPRYPVISVSLYGDLDDRSLKALGDRLRDDVLSLPGVSNVTLSGTRKDEISVEVRPDRLVEYGLSFMQVAEAIAASNLDLSGGLVRTPSANVAVRTLGERQEALDMNDLIVRADADGRVVRLADVADLVDGFEDVEVTGRLDGHPAVSVIVYKTGDQDAVRIASLVRALVAGKMGLPLERKWTERLVARLRGVDEVQDVYERAGRDPYPGGVGVKTRMDLSRLVEDRLDLLRRNGQWGLMLVFLTLLCFLRLRVAFWVMMGLVLAICGSLICMKFLGQTLNLMTLGGFIVVLGLLVDDAIIVSEHVYSKVEKGMEPELAAIMGTEEVTWPVVCTIVTTILAFLPLRFMEGQIGDWMGVLPVVVCIALAVSVAEALTILPSHLAHSLRAGTRSAGRLTSDETGRAADGGVVRSLFARLRDARSAWQRVLMERYQRLLRVAVTYRYVTVAALLSCGMVTAGVVAGGHVPVVFLQKIDSETLMVNVRMPVGTPAQRTEEAMRIVEQAAMRLPEMRSIYTLVGLQLSEDGLPSAPQTYLAQSFIELTRADERARSSDAITAALRADVGEVPGAEKLQFKTLDGGPGGVPFHLEIRGENVEDLVAAAGEIKERLGGFDGVFDIMDDFEAGRPEVHVELLPSARALGLSTRDLATQVRAAFYGFEARKVQRAREDVRIMVRYPAEHRVSLYDLESMYVATPGGDVGSDRFNSRSHTGSVGVESRSHTGGLSQMVPLGEVARLTEGAGFAAIERTDQLRTVTVTADVDETVTNAADVSGAVASTFPDLQRRYPGISFEYGGQQLEMAVSFGSLKQKFVIALVLIYAVLAGLFRSYVQPVIVMAVIPFGAIGAVAGHWLMGYPLTIASQIGLVALTGVVVNDSLVLISFVNRRCGEGADAFAAVTDAAVSRLRPILLTSATTVLGMGPLLLETSFQAKFLIPMGISLSAGLIFATTLTLLAVPSLYLIVEDVRRAGLTLWGSVFLTTASGVGVGVGHR